MAAVWSLPAAAADASVKTAVSLETPSTGVAVGSPVRLAGVVTDPVEGATTVAILQRTGARWKSVATTDIAEDGAFSVAVTPDRAGSWQLLAQYKAGKLRVRSAVLTLDVLEVPSVWNAASAGGWSTAAVAGDGTLWVWGDNERGQLGLGAVDEDPHPVPSQVTTDTAWTAVSASEDHTLALKADGTLWTWGGDGEGQLGRGEATTTAGAPARIGDGHDWSAVAAGWRFSLGLKKDGSLWAWGANGNGQLGQGDGQARLSPARVGRDSDWAAVAAGWNHATALKTDGTLWAWGFNGNGQLGVGDTRARLVPTAVIGDTTEWRTVSCGRSFTLAVSSGGELLGWGYNGNGQLGLGDTAQRLVPTRAGTRTDWAAVAGGWYHGLGLRTDGTLWSFGWNGRGQLGLGDAEDRSSPTRVGDDAGWTAISAGAGFSLGVREDGSLFTWGDNELGQLGLGDTEPKDVPAQVGPADD
jgi:alpha-tubulin suppressor-like RCC1 family protein